MGPFKGDETENNMPEKYERPAPRGGATGFNKSPDGTLSPTSIPL